ncbi:MAG: hypothetical protein IJN36_04770, partial [Clostridia bacterium]|nr:hypothetical protein [Clostridia bacterium]
MILNKNSKAAVIIPKEPTAREEFAASELKKYIKKICGAELTVITDDETFAGAVFAIGGPERNSVTKKYISEDEFDAIVPGSEGLFIKSYGDTVVLAGSSKNDTDFERGTLYAVYELLERFLGASFGAFTKQDIPGGEFIPECEEIRIEEIFYAKAKADVPLRIAVAQYEYQDRAECYDYELDIPFLDWLAKNRYNYINSWTGVYTHY